ncbi:MAG: DUF1054 family protein [Candidatus Binatus sp.]
MATLGFLRRDFDVFRIDGFSARMARIDEFIRPRLARLSIEFAPELSRKLRMEFFPHVEKHMRTAKPPDETWAAFGPSRAGYRRYGYLALCISGAGIHARAVVKRDANDRHKMGQTIKSKSSELERSFRDTRIQDYKDWDCRDLPESRAANAVFFDELGDMLAEKTGSIDVGFGWPVRDALTLDRAELLDAFRELEPVYRVLREVERRIGKRQFDP